MTEPTEFPVPPRPVLQNAGAYFLLDLDALIGGTKPGGFILSPLQLEQLDRIIRSALYR